MRAFWDRWADRLIVVLLVVNLALWGGLFARWVVSLPPVVIHPEESWWPVEQDQVTYGG